VVDKNKVSVPARKRVEMSDSEDFSDEDGGKFKFKVSVNPLDSLPLDVLKRVNALRNLQLSNVKHEVEYFKELHRLDLKYKKLFDLNNEERRKIICGEQEPSAAESEWEDPEDLLNKRLEELKVSGAGGDGVSGIPSFWLTVLQNANSSLLSGSLQAIDEPVLKHLQDITCSDTEDNSSFTLSFHFSQNEFFTNSILTKVYEMKNGIDKDDPLDFDGPEIFKCKGCKIEWKSGKNTTMKVIRQKIKQKGKGKGGQKVVTKTEKRDSFFNFFSPPKFPEDPKEDLDDEVQAIISEDFDIGYSFREKIIPKAVLYFTGDGLDDDEDEDSEFDSDEDIDDDIDEDA